AVPLQALSSPSNESLVLSAEVMAVNNTPPVTNDALFWLEKVARAANTTSFSGVYTYGIDSEWGSAHVEHRWYEGEAYRKTIYLTGYPRTMVHVGNITRCLHKGQHPANLSHDVFHPIELALRQSGGELLENYRVTMDMTPLRIAGYNSFQMSILPKISDRYGYHVWLEENSGLPMRVDVLDEKNKLIRIYQFAEVTIGEDIPLSLFNLEGPGHFVSLPVKDNEADSRSGSNLMISKHWQPAYLPSGFKAVSDPVVMEQNKRHHQRFSDGLSQFSLFVDRLDSGKPITLDQSMGPSSAAIRSTYKDEELYRIIVVGELPLTTASKIADSVVQADTPIATQSIGH
ncbi:MAG: MucB/RseB C-terminal domain-containing protein, partial [Oleibacter sp.]|nr:MucB/RseB C-terminal domain-containing protein [Thalassolituus sp.]